jgi:hypothetical protein
MSSEKRSISPCAFDSDVPPLKTRDLANRDFWKSSFSYAHPEILFDDGWPDAKPGRRLAKDVTSIRRRQPRQFIHW